MRVMEICVCGANQKKPFTLKFIEVAAAAYCCAPSSFIIPGVAGVTKHQVERDNVSIVTPPSK